MFDFAPILHAIESKQIPSSFADLFGPIWDQSSSRFNTQESYTLDFKETIPLNFSDEYGIGIVRLALALHNSYGGVIVFGVRDRSQNIVGVNEIFDIEVFNRLLSDVSNTNLHCIVKTLEATVEPKRQIAVLLVPKRGIAAPAVLTRDFGKYGAGTCWIRDRHEVLIATDQHLPMLYSKRSNPPDRTSDALPYPVHRSLPPSPATLHQFVSRRNLMDALWRWFVLGDQPRLYLDGPGGSGKSTLAFEFARVLAEMGSDIVSKQGDRVDYVLYISGKETEYNTQAGKEQTFALRQFESSTEQFAQILYHSGFLNEPDLESQSDEKLDELLSELFDNFSGLIVIDDIDALTRRKVDTGEEQLLIKAVQARKRTRLLYTLRQPPSHAKKSAVSVPGLDSATELPDFLQTCCAQFDAPMPVGQHIKEIETATNKLPLLIETIVWSRKFSGDYVEAIRAFKERGGDGARRYLYQREYDRLQEGKSRQLLAGACLLGEPVSFSTLASLFQFTRDQLIDAISESSVVFLVATENDKGETLYQLSPPCVPFIDEVSKGISHYELLKRKVEHLKSINVRMSPREAAIFVTLERMVRKRDHVNIANICEAIPSGDLALENPRIRAIMGRAYSSLGPDYREKARQCFRHAESLKYLDIFMLRSWFHLEVNSGYGLDEAERLCRIVIDDEQMSPRYKSEFWSKLGSCHYQRSFSYISLDAVRAFALLRESIKAYLESAWIARSLRMSSIETVGWMSKPIRQLASWAGEDFEQLFVLLEELSEQKHDVDIEGIEAFLELFLRSPVPKQKRQRDRLKGLCSRSINRISRNKRPLSANKGFETVVNTLEALQAKLQELK
ncbi:RNA-binding domain-containing protein [Bradyrhizobium sp. CCGUVB23]|uniref:RNA-binding domain-containing protein n=1 Tax=Bradyrhizobium sp. CCGUVB23 TaxID=2949630 RepID=UPI0020B34E21|nr:RNA-binding domain-containing protein [Bradyrhizobium sp. CCGUVB23]MCP3462136.1 putative DNA binding domain-containing protein [Bradyrhizobium sp. CCGUVB23]